MNAELSLPQGTLVCEENLPINEKVILGTHFPFLCKVTLEIIEDRAKVAFVWTDGFGVEMQSAYSFGPGTYSVYGE